MWPAAVLWGVSILLFARHPDRARDAALAGAMCGVVASAHLWGIYYYAPSVYYLVLAYHAAVWGAYAGVATLLIRRAGATMPLVGGGLWALWEGLRAIGATSFPFFFGGMLASELPIAQLASLVGAAGVSGLVFAVGYALAGVVLGWLGEPRWLARRVWLPAIFTLGLAYAWGSWRLSRPAPARRSLRVATLQGSVPQWLYSLATGTGPFRSVVEEHYGALYRAALESKPHPELVAMPETTFDWHEQPTTEGIRRLGPIGASRIPGGTSVLFGASFRGHDGTSRNAVALVEPGENGQPVLREIVEKRRMVPFIEAGHKPAARWASGHVGDLHLGVLICYESMYPEGALDFARQGVDLLVIATDDAGLRFAPIAWTHSQQARLRAIEVGIPLVRAGQVGTSYALDAYGRELASLGPWETGVLHADVPRLTLNTVYRRVGLAWLWVWALAALTGEIARVASRARTRSR